jgi:hypothetical protein
MSVDPYPGPDFTQELDPTLQALADLSTSADTAPFFTDIDQAALMTVTPLARTLLNDTTPAQMRETLQIPDTPPAPTGLAGTVAFFGTTGSLTSDSELRYDPITNRLGINTTTLTAPLTFSNALGRKIDFYTGYGIGLQNSQLQIYGDTGAQISLGNMAADGTTFTSRLDIRPTGIKAHTNIGLPQEPPVNVWVRTGSLSADSIGIAYGDVAPGHALHVNGYGMLTGIGVGGSAPQANWSIYTGANWSYFGGRVGIGISPGHLLHVNGDMGIAGGSTLAGVVGIGGGPNASYNLTNHGTSYLYGLVGIGGVPTAGWNLHCPGSGYIGTAQLGRTGIAYAVDGNYWLRCGIAYFDALISGGKIMGASHGYGYDPPRWPLDINGQGHILQLGVYYGPPGAVWFRTASAAFDSVQVGRGDAAARWPLDVAGAGHIQQLGVAYGADVAATDGVSLRASTVKFDQLGVGYVFASGLSIRAGNSYFDAAGFGYAGGLGYNLRAGSANCDSILTGQQQVSSWLGIAGAQDTRWNLTNWGTSYFSGTSQFTGVVGFGGAPDGRFTTRTYGPAYYDNVVGFQVVAGGSYSIQVGGQALFHAYVTMNSGLGVMGAVTAYGSGFQPGGGPWYDSNSSRELKTNIRNIESALETLLRLRGRTWDWKEEQRALKRRLPGRRFGFVIEEVEQIFPQWIDTLDGKKGMSEKGFPAYTVEALRELVTRLEAAEATLARLEAA